MAVLCTGPGLPSDEAYTPAHPPTGKNVRINSETPHPPSPAFPQRLSCSPSPHSPLPFHLHLHHHPVHSLLPDQNSKAPRMQHIGTEPAEDPASGATAGFASWTHHRQLRSRQSNPRRNVGVAAQPKQVASVHDVALRGYSGSGSTRNRNTRTWAPWWTNDLPPLHGSAPFNDTST